MSFWALDAAGVRAELLGVAEQEPDGRFAEVWSNDPRALESVLELRDGAGWREVRSRRFEPAGARVLPRP